jgi:hypothetical protein
MPQHFEPNLPHVRAANQKMIHHLSPLIAEHAKRVVMEAMAPGMFRRPVPAVEHKPKEKMTFSRGFTF